MSQNATHSAHKSQKRHTPRTPFGALEGGWVFTPLVLELVLSVVFAVFGYRMRKRESEELHHVFNQHLSLVRRVLEVASEHELRDGHKSDLHNINQSMERNYYEL